MTKFAKTYLERSIYSLATCLKENILKVSDILQLNLKNSSGFLQ